MKLEQIQEIVKDIPGVKVLDNDQEIPNGKSALELKGGLDSFKLKSNQLILVESIESTLSRSCKVRLNAWNPFHKQARDKIKVRHTNSIYVITTVTSINDLFVNFHKYRDFYKSIESIKYKLYDYREPEYYNDANIYSYLDTSDELEDYQQNLSPDELEDYQNLSPDEQYEDYLYCRAYEDDEIDYSGINPLSPLEYRQVGEWVEVNDGDRISNEKVISKGIKGHMVINGPTFYEDNFNFDDKGEGEQFISDIIIGDKLLSIDGFTNLVNETLSCK